MSLRTQRTNITVTVMFLLIGGGTALLWALATLTWWASAHVSFRVLWLSLVILVVLRICMVVRRVNRDLARLQRGTPW
jgi:hypothetical protein